MEEAAMESMLTDARRHTINMGAGPSSLPTQVLAQATRGLIDYANTGIGITELSHRSSTFIDLVKESQHDLRTLFGLPERYEILYMQGGGLTQFSMTFLNMLAWYKHSHPTSDVPTVDYIVSGSWSAKAAGEARRLGGANINIVVDGRTLSQDGKTFGALPDQSQWNYSEKPAWIYYCANETVNGVEIPPPSLPDRLKQTPLVSDMSSNILSRSVDFESYNFAIVYAGAQKNIGPSGLTVGFVRKDILVDVDEAARRGGPIIPAMMAYKNLADNDSLYNTPPMFSIYVAGLVFKTLLDQGGIPTLEKVNREKARRVYEVLDDSKGFYIPRVQQNIRSRMNVVFVCKGGPEVEARLISAASQAGIKQIKGHRSVGGVRASLYNAITLEAVDQLVRVLQDFQAGEQR
ncbi:hypothetical protein E5Q_06706 [Mixia osmundae IAM 14324]|uniref:phosphoserine transaminase n=1 Tax=Mixia osmundae (strain CBS 9802 / IAM 14324 / JCM 22182 / KY 12970) TaxID=764103 RepID=G7EAZ3_MIXOS|nr:hypothetical protein E5Q_06706 [Mixia osmundae IAM 14324]